MRVTTGICKGRKLFVPKTHLVRPASDKVKQSVFNIIGLVENFSILDLFAGSGSMAIEGLSRGAAKSVLVDFLPEALKTIERNIELCGFQGQAQVIRGKIPFILKTVKKISPDPFDLVFVDPPYDHNLVNLTLDKLIENNLIDATSLIIIEHSPREKVSHEGYITIDHRKYGQTLMTFLNLK
ncbi:MAG: hypothetical protein ACD_73C00321G0002 [uncultured bacterium]|nr:MAG: hypothetical protein ACD_73C00321G0002 [uncultured bacterium]